MNQSERTIRRKKIRARQKELAGIQRDRQRAAQQLVAELNALQTTAETEKEFATGCLEAKTRYNRRLESLMARIKRAVPSDFRMPVDHQTAAKELGITEEEAREGLEICLKLGVFDLSEENGERYIVHKKRESQ